MLSTIVKECRENQKPVDDAHITLRDHLRQHRILTVVFTTQQFAILTQQLPSDCLVIAGPILSNILGQFLQVQDNFSIEILFGYLGHVFDL